MVVLLSYIIVLLLPCRGAEAENPGFVVHLTQKGLGLVSAFSRDLLEKYLASDRTIPLSGKRGSVEYQLHGIAVKSYKPNFDVDIAFSPPRSIRLKMKDISVKLESPYKVSIWIFYNTGTIEADIQDFNADVMLDVAMDDGRLQPTLGNCEAHIDTLSINFRGGLINKIMNLFRKKIARKIRGMLSEKVCGYVRDKMTGELQKALFNVPLSTTLFKSYHLNYTLVANPGVTSTFMESKHSGSVFAVTNSTTRTGSNKALYDMIGAKMIPPPFPRLRFIDGPAHMINLYLSEWTMDSLFYYLTKYGALNVEFIKETMPDNFKDFLDTDCDFLCAGAMFPQLREKFPHSSMDIRIAMQDPPKVQFSKDAMNVSTVMNVTGFARKLGGSMDQRKFVFSTLADAMVTLHLKFKNQSIIGGLKFHGVKLRALQSIVGDITLRSFDPIMSYAVNDFIEPHFAKFLSDGIRIPKTGPFSFADGNISPSDDILTFAANFKYNLK